MADDDQPKPARKPAKKVARKVAAKPAVKAPKPAVKPAVKKAPAKRVAPPLAPRRPPVADTIGEAEERHPDEPVVAFEPYGPGLVDELVDGLLGDAEVHERSPLLVRVVRGEWVPALKAALPAVLVTVLGIVAGTVALLFADQPGGDEPLVEDLTVGRWVRVVLVGVGMAFGSPFSSITRAGDESQAVVVGVVPLTVTLLALAALWVAVRRLVPPEVDPLPAAIRTAVVFAAGIAGLAAFGRWTEDGGEVQQFFEEPEIGVTTVSVAPFKAMFWAFLAALAVTYVARRPFRVPLPVRGALAGLAAGIGASFVTLVALAYAYAGRVEAGPSDVTTVLPTAVGYAIGLGTAGLAVAMGGEVTSPVGNSSVSLFESWVPGGYVALLAIPVLAVAAGVAYIVRSGGVSREEAARACGQMALPAALLWFGLALVGSVSYRFNVFILVSSMRVGAVLWGALLVLVWFGVLGWLGGHLVLRRANLSGATDRRSLPLGAAEGPD